MEQRVADVMDQLTRDVSPDPLVRGERPDDEGRWLLAQLIPWHRREDKAAWWRYYELTKLTDDELRDEKEPIAGLELVGDPEPASTGRSLVYKAAWLKDQGQPFALAAAMAKLYTGELANRVVNQAVQIHGGYGFMDEYAVSRLYRDQKVLEIGEGTNEVQRMVIARELGF